MPRRQVPVLPSKSSLLRFAFRFLLLWRSCSDMQILISLYLPLVELASCVNIYKQTMTNINAERNWMAMAPEVQS